MPNTHEDLEHLVLAGMNFRNAFERLRLKIRVQNSKLLTDPEWNNAPISIRIAWAEITLAAEEAFTTIIEDATLLSTKQQYYRVNRRPNQRRKDYQRRRRYEMKQKQILDAPQTTSLSFMTPEQAVNMADTAPPDPITPTAETFLPNSSPTVPTQFDPEDEAKIWAEIEAAKAKAILPEGEKE